MSGGHFNYLNDTLCYEIYGWGVDPDYGNEGFKQSEIARDINPLEDFIVSELVFDVLCLLHSYDWYKSGDTDEETYREDVKHFKEKWLKLIPESTIRGIVDERTTNLRDELYRAFNIEILENSGKIVEETR